MAEQEITRLSLERYTPEAKALVVETQALADRARHAEVTPLHLLSECLNLNASAAEVFRRAGVNLAQMRAMVDSGLLRQPVARENACLSVLLLELMGRAEQVALREPRGNVGLEHLLLALTQEERGAVGEILGAFHLVPTLLRPHLAEVVQAQGASFPADGASGSQARSELGGLPSSGQFSPFTVPLLQGADKLGPVIGRKVERSRLQTILERRAKHHPLLVGEVGVGKATIVRGVAEHLSGSNRSLTLRGTKFQRLDVGALGAGSRQSGELESRVRQLLKAFASSPGGVLVIPGLEQLYTAGGALGGLGDWLRSSLERQELRLVCTTTPEGERRVQQADPLLYAMLTRLPVSEPNAEAAIQMVRGVAELYDKHHGVTVSDEAVQSAVHLAKRYLSDRSLPDSALDLVDESAAALRIRDSEGDSKSEKMRLRSEHVARTLGTWTGVPVAKMLEAEADKLSRMEERLRERVVGQDAALQKIARAVRRSRVGLRNPRRPIGSFLFLGPSGVGKTELARALAHFLFDDEEALTRLDMSEYVERHMAQRLIGAPPGYADSERGGLLTEAVRQRPYSVLLFDEVEKAHQDVFNLLLQVLDDGRLTDGRGRVADFSNTVVILTSNIGARKISQADPERLETDTGLDELRTTLQNELVDFFRPEFLNRLDDVALFGVLGRAQLFTIAELQLEQLKSVLKTRGLSLTVSEDATTQLVALAYQPSLGARPLERAIVQHIQDPIAEGLLGGQFASGQHLEIELAEGGLMKLSVRS